jgi:hypothetical protein
MTYLLFWAAAALPGVPLGLRLNGRNPIGWISGLALGYTTSCLVSWAVIAAGAASGPAFLAAWGVECAVVWLIARVWPWPTDVAAWSRRDTAICIGVLALAPLLMAAPYGNVGAVDRTGTRYYRAYFTADFVWHMALTSELGRFEMPPRNPYMASEPLHYYWTYFLVPAAVTATGPTAVEDVERALKINAICTATILMASLFLLAWTAGGSSTAAAIAVVLVVMAASAEGLSAIWDLVARGRSLAALRDLNIDAMTAWKYQGLRIDGVHRTMLYTPQHGLSCALALLALVPAVRHGVSAPFGVIATSAVFLGLSTAVNPFLGAAFSLIYALFISADAVRSRCGTIVFMRHAVAAAPPVVAAGWGILNNMSGDAGSAVTFGVAGYARNAPILTLLLSLGPVLVPALFAFLPDRRLPFRPLLLAGCGLLVGLGLLYFVMLSDRSWVGFRAGQILLATLTVPLANVFGRLLLSGRRAAALALAAAILGVGAPTVLIDLRNAADIGNRAMGPGFPWTLTVSPAQQEAIAWVRAHTPAGAIVQLEPMVRGRGHWSFIPTFAQRRMAAGLPISLLPDPAYEARSRQVREIFTSTDAARAHDIARRLRIGYLWIDGDERQAYPKGVAAIDVAAGYFQPVFRNQEVTVYKVR